MSVCPKTGHYCACVRDDDHGYCLYSAAPPDATQPAQPQEPVAWRYRFLGFNDVWHYTGPNKPPCTPPERWEVEPLYAAPAAPPEAPQPTREQLLATIERLRRDLADPPPDVQEAVIAKLGLQAEAPQAQPQDADTVIVPREPTGEMIAAGWIDTEDVGPRDIWYAMVNAAPSQAEALPRFTDARSLIEHCMADDDPAQAEARRPVGSQRCEVCGAYCYICERYGCIDSGTPVGDDEWAQQKGKAHD